MSTLSILEQLCFSTTRIETENVAGEKFSGIGFFYNLIISYKTIPLIVTNKHVVKNMKKGLFRLTTSDSNGNPDYTNLFKVSYDTDFEKMWNFHPDENVDLCVLPIKPLLEAANKMGAHLFYRCLDNSLIPSQDQIEDLDAVEDIIMIGYPNGLWDSVNNMPIIRKGITATSVGRDYEGRKEFLIDAACFPGSSGSPVLMCDVGYFTDKKNGLYSGNRVYLLGILYAGPQLTVEGEIKVVTIPNVQQKALSISHIPNNLGYVIKSERLLDFTEIFRPIINKNS
jgi:hypothetical protein